MKKYIIYKNITIIVANMEIQLFKPEDKIIEQFDETNSLYIITNGSCKVIDMNQKLPHAIH